MLKNLKIKEKFFVIQCIMMLIVCAVTLAAFHTIAESYESQIYAESAEILQLASKTIDNEMKKVEKLSFQISTDSRIQQYLSERLDENATYESFKNKENLANRLLLFMHQENYISSLRIVDSRGAAVNTVLYSIADPPEDMEQVAIAGQGENRWIYGAPESQHLIAVRQIKGMENLNLEHYGVLMAWIDMGKLVKQQLDLSGSKLFFIAQQDRFVYSSQQGFFEERQFPFHHSNKGYTIEEIAGAKYLVSYLKSESNDELTYYNILPYESIAQKTEELRSLVTILFVALFVIVIIATRITAHSITKPLAALTEKIKMVQRGSFDVPDTHHSFANMDETGQLHRNFRIMLEKINELFTENYQKQIVIKETEYKALEAQINPHFLYNTLDTINWMAHINKQSQIAEMVEALGQMFRSIISKKKQLITLEEELQIVKDYITIQRHRFNERLIFKLKADQEAMQALIPKLTIQPLVENAIQHALEMMSEPCTIEVAVQLLSPPADDFSVREIKIMIRDNGPGMEQEVLQGLRNGEVRSKKAGIGMSNINERLAIMFGEQYQTRIDSQLNRGTSITIILPYKEGEQDA